MLSVFFVFHSDIIYISKVAYRNVNKSFLGLKELIFLLHSTIFWNSFVTSMCMYVNIYLCMYMHMCTCTYTYIHIHTYIHMCLCVKPCLRELLLINMGVQHWKWCMIKGKHTVKYGNKLDVIWFDPDMFCCFSRRQTSLHQTTWIIHDSVIF